MRSHVLHRTYLWRKWLDARLHALLGARWTPLYAMVAFTRTPYAECRRLRERQDRVRYHMDTRVLRTRRTCVALRCVQCALYYNYSNCQVINHTVRILVLVIVLYILRSYCKYEL